MMDRVEMLSFRHTERGYNTMAVLSPRAKPIDPSEPQAAIPRLENGDRLSRAEFERRYEAMPELKKAELIEGEVYVGSPVRHRQHSEPHLHSMAGWQFTWLARRAWRRATTAASAWTRPTMPQPDAFLMIKPERGGQARITDDDYVEGAPELIAEIAASSVSYDLGKKLHAYRRNGVREYVVWRVQDREIDWFVLRERKYEPLAARKRRDPAKHRLPWPLA